MSRRFSLSAWLAALALLLLSMMAAPARSHTPGTSTFSCVGGYGTGSCVVIRRPGVSNPHVISVPAPQSDADRQDADARDRIWFDRCRPLVRQDRYGMPRYSYGAPGCEFGRID